MIWSLQLFAFFVVLFCLAVSFLHYPHVCFLIHVL